MVITYLMEFFSFYKLEYTKTNCTIHNNGFIYVNFIFSIIFIQRLLPDQAFAHCPRFPIAASHRSLGHVSVLVWLIIQKDQLSIVGLVSLYLTQKTIRTKAIFLDSLCLKAFLSIVIAIVARVWPSP